MLIDTHAHIHFKDYGLPLEQVLENAAKAGVERIICVGTDIETSELAIKFAAQYPLTAATIGLHPHDAKAGLLVLEKLTKLCDDSRVVAVGECGLDYFYNYSPKANQKQALKFQIELALSKNLPLIFHVRDAFADFLAIVDRYPNIKGVVHSFTGNINTAKQLVERGFYLGLNGIITFTKDPDQLATVQAIPLSNLVLETDCPFLTPAPLRGKINEPANVKIVAEFLAQLRGVERGQVAQATTANAKALFNLETL